MSVPRPGTGLAVAAATIVAIPSQDMKGCSAMSLSEVSACARRRSSFNLTTVAALTSVAVAAVVIRPSDPGAQAVADGTAGKVPLVTWGAVASTGIPDEGSANKFAFSGPLATLKAGINGPATLRYNVTAADGFYTTAADGVTLWVRRRDNGAGARVRAWFKAHNVVSGDSTTLSVYDSNDFAPSSGWILEGLDLCTHV